MIDTLRQGDAERTGADLVEEISCSSRSASSACFVSSAVKRGPEPCNPAAGCRKNCRTSGGTARRLRSPSLQPVASLRRRCSRYLARRRISPVAPWSTRRLRAWRCSTSATPTCRPASCDRGLFTVDSAPRSRAAWRHVGLWRNRRSGPTGNRYGDPPGHTCMAVAGSIERAFSLRTGSADRRANMDAFARRALEFIYETISG